MQTEKNENADHDRLRAVLGKDDPNMPYGLPPGFVFSMPDEVREELGITKP